MHRITNFIDGEQREPHSGGWLENVEPATGAVYGSIAASDARDVDDAVQAARRAFPEWSQTPAAERSRVMLCLADLVERDGEAFARAESIDTGKPIALAQTVDIPRAIANLRFFATAILHTHTEAHVTEAAAPGGGRAAGLNYTLRKPLGVVGCISPWNLPLYLFTWKVAPALATGNTVIGKPSEITPMTAFLLSQLLNEAGFPGGVFNIVHGRGAEAGAAIVRHPDVAAISFTGGTKTGAEISRVAGPMFKKLSLELGGKNPNIIFADADLDDAIETSVRSSFANQGQICLCGSRILVESSVYDSFLDGLIERAQSLRIGHPLEESTQQGALVSQEHREKIESYLKLAVEEGGSIRCGGKRPSHLTERCAGGFFLEPAIITGLGPRCRTNQEEIFGPVVTVMPFEGDAQAIEYANATPYGLSATVWTRDLERAHRVAAAIDAGTVWINCWLLRDLRVPFGGMKQSGVGREGGDEALRFFTEPKNVCIRLR